MKKDWLIGALIGLILTLTLAACAWFESGFTESLEYKLYDLRAKAASVGEALSDQIVLVSIDDASIAQMGRWPWARSLQGELIRRVAEGGPKVIGVNIFWLEPDSNAGMDILGKVKESYQEILSTRASSFKALSADRRFKPLAEDLAGFPAVFDEATAALNQDTQLADVLSVTPRVALPLLFSESRPLAEEGDELLARMPYRISAVGEGAAPAAYTPALPLPEFAADVSGMGFSNVVPDLDGAVRAQPVAFKYRNQYFPALPVEMARLARGLDLEAVKLEPGRALILGDKRVPLDDQSRLLIRYAGLFSTDHKIPAVDVLTDKVDPKAFKDKIVFIALRATGVDTVFVTPAASITPSADVQLNVLQNLLGDKFISRPSWAPLSELASLLLVGLFVTLLLPFLKARGGALAALALLLGIGGAGWYLFLAKGWWLKIFYPAALLVLDYTLVTLRRFFFTEKRKELVEAQSIDTNKDLGLQYQSQGMLDMAYEKFRRCPVDDAMKGILYNLALDFERKRQFGKAAAVYEHIAETDPKYKDVTSKISSSKQASETMISGPLGRPRDGSGTMMSGSSDVKPTLGKYEIQKELGRGAMGVVYLGRDPKINRMVALKTLNIDSDLDEASVKDIKDRFFREAESAGTLNHPNIVKIFDADEDKATQVSYIAMELLDGEDLKKYADKNNLLPAAMVVEHIAVIADALDYAHDHGVVHRDIKPANIMKLKDGSLRVTDFGIARITASSKTATGTVLGTPSYMSPEQVAGRKVDGRADLFSLGVMFYEMLTGFKPFEGDSIATLLFRIASEPHPDPIEKASARVTAALKGVIDRALEKDPEKRYQRGGDMARDLRAAAKGEAPAASAPAAPKPAPAAPVPPMVPPPAIIDRTDPSLSKPPVPAPPKPSAAEKTDPSFPVPPMSLDRTVPASPPPAPKPAAIVPPAPPAVPSSPKPTAPPIAPPPAPPKPAAPPVAAVPPSPSGPPPPPPPPRERPPLVLPSMDDLGFEIVKPGTPAVPRPPAPPAAPAAPRPSDATFEIVLPPAGAAAPPAAPKPAAPSLPPPAPEITLEIERPALPPKASAAPARPSDETARLGETARMEPPKGKGADETFQIRPPSGSEGTQKL